jgi:hypothetical protein
MTWLLMSPRVMWNTVLSLPEDDKVVQSSGDFRNASVKYLKNEVSK